MTIGRVATTITCIGRRSACIDTRIGITTVTIPTPIVVGPGRFPIRRTATAIRGPGLVSDTVRSVATAAGCRSVSDSDRSGDDTATSVIRLIRHGRSRPGPGLTSGTRPWWPRRATLDGRLAPRWRPAFYWVLVSKVHRRRSANRHVEPTISRNGSAVDKKQKKRLDVINKKLSSLRQQLAGSRQQADDPDELKDLEQTIAKLEAEVAEIKASK